MALAACVVGSSIKRIDFIILSPWSSSSSSASTSTVVHVGGCIKRTTCMRSPLCAVSGGFIGSARYTHCVELVVRISPMRCRMSAHMHSVSFDVSSAKMKNEIKQQQQRKKNGSTNVLCERFTIRNIDYCCCCCGCCCRSLTLILGARSAPGVSDAEHEMCARENETKTAQS